jgi:hypothetical protein
MGDLQYLLGRPEEYARTLDELALIHDHRRFVEDREQWVQDHYKVST